MPSAIDSGWCQVSPARATPNEAVPLPAWAASVTVQAQIPGRQIHCTRVGRSAPIPNGHPSPAPERVRAYPRLPSYRVYVVAPRRIRRRLRLMTSIAGRCPRTLDILGKSPGPPCSTAAEAPPFRALPPSPRYTWQQGEP